MVRVVLGPVRVSELVSELVWVWVSGLVLVATGWVWVVRPAHQPLRPAVA